MSPADRRRMDGPGMGSAANNRPPPGQLEPMQGDYDENAPPEKYEGKAETFSAPMSALGGKEFRPGEEVMMKIVKIDKENGTVELTYSTGEDKEEKDEGMGMPEENPAVARMDAAMMK